jgi:outer membrane protein insertion porin family
MEDAAPPAADVSLEEMLATRLRVSGVTVRGAERTSQSFLEYVLAPVAAAGAVHDPSFEAVVEDVSDAVDRLRSTGCYKGVDAFLDRDALEEDAAHVTFTVAEKSLYQIRTGTSVTTSGDRDASVDGSLIWRNIFGRAETLRATAGWWGGGGGDRRAFGGAPSNSLDLHFEKPFFPTRRSSFFARVGQSLRNHEDWSSYSVNVREAEAGLHTPLGRFALRSAWREICDVGDKASILVRDQAGHSLKTSITHQIAVDRRDDPAVPTSGYALAIDSEIAGGDAAPGDVSFAKCEASANVNLPLGSSGIAVALSLRSGVVRPTASDPAVRICDRFHVGGANSLRGFRPRGVGPRDREDALGGETFYVATAMLSAPTPEASLFSQLFNARVHAFATAGDVGHVRAVAGAFDDVRRQKGSLQSMRGVAELVAKSSRVAVGLGIAGETALGRVEINLCNVTRCAPDDRPKTGLQFGLSQSYM